MEITCLQKSKITTIFLLQPNILIFRPGRWVHRGLSSVYKSQVIWTAVLEKTQETHFCKSSETQPKHIYFAVRQFSRVERVA